MAFAGEGIHLGTDSSAAVGMTTLGTDPRSASLRAGRPARGGREVRGERREVTGRSCGVAGVVSAAGGGATGMRHAHALRTATATAGELGARVQAEACGTRRDRAIAAVG